MRKLIVPLMMLMLSAPSAWAEDSFENAKQIVDALESAWDGAANQPVQPEIAGFKTKSLGGLKSAKTAAGQNEIITKVYYPEGTGHKAVDALIKSFAEERMAVYEADAKEFLAEEQSTPGSKVMIFAVTKPSADYLTVVFYESGYMGGAHGFREYLAKTYDLKQGLELKPADVFVNPEDAEDTRPQQFFANYLNAGLDKNCFEQQKEASFCAPAGVTVENVAESLHNVVFTAGGLAVIYGPYEQGSYAEGTKYVDVPKEDLLNWGLSDKFWK